MKKDVHDAFV